MNAGTDIPSRPDYLFWSPFLRGGGYVVVSPYRTKYRGGISPRDALAGANVFALLSRRSETGNVHFEVRDSLPPGMESENLVLIGSASGNPVVATFLEKLAKAGTPLSFSLGSGYWHDSALDEPANLMAKYGTDPDDPDVVELGAPFCTEDVGLVARAPNPYNPGRVVTFIAGIHGYGTLAASRVFCEEEFQKRVEEQLANEPICFSYPSESRDAVVEVVLRAPVRQGAADSMHAIKTMGEITIVLVRVGSRTDRQLISAPAEEIWTQEVPPPRTSENPHSFSIFFPGKRSEGAFVHLQGADSVTQFCDGEVGFSESDCLAYNRRISSALKGAGQWEHEAHRTGQEPEKEWEQEIRRIGQELEQHLQPLLNIVPQGPHLMAHEVVYRFGGPAHYLRIPFEAARIRGDQHYLALLHPVVRSINGLRCTKKPLDAEFTDSLRLQGQKLRVLLVASNPLKDLPEAEAEIAGVKSILKQFSAWIEVTTLTNASAQAFATQLQRDYYHLVHYAGHTHWDSRNPRNSHFLLPMRGGRGGGVDRIFLDQVEHWLRKGSPTRFWYLSSCEGARAGRTDIALQYDFFGFADSLVRAGVPAILGFREKIEDKAALVIAEHFYRSLFKSRVFSLSQAILKARQQAHSQMDQPGWLMPVLIMQH